jgi:phospho-N-acetylmuramoyl-pentapeptide-transferase
LIAAACLGFLVYNRHPAQVFMGNVSSMALGGMLATIALVGGIWYVLPIVAAVFLVEVVSDIIQVGYFKVSGGRRVFRMAPIHHHFELQGWPETVLVRRFWLFGLVAAAGGVTVAALMAHS